MESLKIIPNIKSLLENNREEDAVEIINKYIDSIAYYLKDILPQFKANSESSSLCLSKIYLILQNYEKSIEFAVKSGSLFKNDGSFYFKTLVNHMMDFLIKDNHYPCRKFIIEMIQKDVLSDSYIGYLYTIKEYEKFDFFFKIYLESYDRPKEFIKFIMKSAEENNDKERIYKVIYEMYCEESLSEENDNGSKEEDITLNNTLNNLTTTLNTTPSTPSLIWSHPTVYFLMDSLVFLNQFFEIKKILVRLEKDNPPLCYDLCFYLEDNFKIKFHNENYEGKNIPLILRGDFKRDLLQRFLTSNNLTSFRFLDSIAKTRSPHIGFVNALMNLGSTNDTFYRSNSDLLSSSKDWSKFNDVAYLGIIHLNNNLPYEVLKNYLPSESNNKEGGALYALGLINRKTYNEEDNEFLLYFLEKILNENNNGNNSLIELSLGTCFGLGLINMGSNNENLIQKLLTLSKTDNTIISESAVYGLGLIALGSSNENLLKELEILKNETEFERVKRTIGISYSLILCNVSGGIKSGDNGMNMDNKGNDKGSYGMNNNGMNVDTNSMNMDKGMNVDSTTPIVNPNNILNFINDLLDSKDSLSRFGGVLSLGSSYVGTGNLEIISKLLNFLNDGDDDVKRSTVISISLVCCDDQDLLISTLEPLSENHNFFVRSIVCLCLGFFNAGSGNKTCCDIVEALIHDSNNLVRQSACIGMGFLLMQCNPSIIQNYKRIVDTINKIIIDRCEEPCVKHGAVIGRGISEAGGRNIIFSIKNMNNKITPERVTGAILFLNHWYWYPLMPMLSLNYLPTPFYVFDENLNEIKKSIKYKGNYDNHLIRLPDIKRSRGFKNKPTEDKEIITKAHPEVETSTRCTMIQQEECGIEWPGVFFTKQ